PASVHAVARNTNEKANALESIKVSDCTASSTSLRLEAGVAREDAAVGGGARGERAQEIQREVIARRTVGGRRSVNADEEVAGPQTVETLGVVIVDVGTPADTGAEDLATE